MYVNVATHAIVGPLCLDAFPSLYDDKRADILITISILMALSIIAVGLRFLARRLSTIQMGLDDALILLALVSLTWEIARLHRIP